MLGRGGEREERRKGKGWKEGREEKEKREERKKKGGRC